MAYSFVMGKLLNTQYVSRRIVKRRVEMIDPFINECKLLQTFHPFGVLTTAATKSGATVFAGRTFAGKLIEFNL